MGTETRLLDLALGGKVGGESYGVLLIDSFCTPLCLGGPTFFIY